MSIYLISLIFFVIAGLYASVGFGGGSSYITILLLVGMVVEDVRLIALICNIVVVLGLKPIQTKDEKTNRTLSPITRSAIGSGIGFVSGLIGIGGGIFLSPLLSIMKWQTAKVISVTASVFILFNSVAGIAGQLTNGISVDIRKILILGLSVLVGGQIGNYLNIKILTPHGIRILTAILVGVAGMRFILINT